MDELDTRVVDEGKALALLSHASLFTGLPLFIIPMIQRDNAFALIHAKYAGVAYLGYFVIGAASALVTFVTCGLGAPLVLFAFLMWIPAIQGALSAINGKVDPPLLVGDWAERLFGGVQPK